MQRRLQSVFDSVKGLNVQSSTKKVPTPEAISQCTDVDATLKNGIRAEASAPPHPQTVRRKTLIVGDSVLKGIHQRGLSDTTVILSRPGATATEIAQRLKEWDLKTYKAVIIYVGGNDAASGSIQQAHMELKDVIDSLQRQNITVYLCTLCPRVDVDIVPTNNMLRQLSQDIGVNLIENYGAFIYANGYVARHYYMRDGIHLNNSGSRTLVASINRHVAVIKQGTTVRSARNDDKSNVAGNGRQQGYTPRNNGHVFCTICHMSTHHTRECRRRFDREDLPIAGSTSPV